MKHINNCMWLFVLVWSVINGYEYNEEQVPGLQIVLFTKATPPVKTDISTVELEFNRTKYRINWKNVSEVLTSRVIQNAWFNSNLLETLHETMQKRKGILKLKTINVNNTKYNFCESFPSLEIINITSDFNYSSLPGFLGSFNVINHELTSGVLVSKRDLFTDTSNIMGLFYEIKLNAETFKITFDDSNVIISGIMTANWILVSITNSSSKVNGQCVALMFGEPEKFPPLKGYVSYNDLVVIRDENYALALIAPVSYGTLGLNFLPQNLTKMFFEILNSPLTVIDYLKGKLFAMEAKGACQNPSNEQNILSFVFEVTAVHFLFVKKLNENQPVNVGCVVKHVAALRSLEKLFKLCFPNFELHSLNLWTLSRIAASQVANLPPNNVITLDTEKQEVIFSMFKLASDDNDVNKIILNEISIISDQMYTMYSNTYQLSSISRHFVMDIYEVLTTLSLTNIDVYAFYSYILFTSMCNNVEISYMINQISHPDDIAIFQVFSPCFLSLRFDLDENKLRSDAPQTSKRTGSELALGASGFWRLLHAFHATRVSAFSVINCTRLAWKQVTALMPLENITYVISPVRPEHARVYEVSEVFLNSAMFISAVFPNCSHFTPPNANLHIPILYNFSAPRVGCPMCNSIVLSYDENQGLQTMMYVSNPIVQANLFSPYSPFFDNDNFHIHYLWLMNNGTVVEIRGLYRRHTLNAIALVFAFIGTMSALYFLFKLFSILT
ncbi:ORF22 [macacine gammaherpesvirus 12]|uniref:ORF22 n=1 Tax=macacine gammaherpesvirus 12 TaxID=2560571 RepID=A0A0B5D6E0_9GAMA|nr:ORF22 [Macaca nemestrina rhadinovirus 2]AJE29663.1 ORF22 [Macaca nemestrina rhadinovirus 2]